MKIITKTIRDTKDYNHLTVNESRDGDNDEFLSALISYDYGCDHGHISLNEDEMKQMIDILTKILKVKV